MYRRKNVDILSGEEDSESRQKKLLAINRRFKKEHKLDAPWSTGYDDGLSKQSVAAESMADGVATRTKFHHYYKRHMTMLGLRNQLDSSESESDEEPPRTTGSNENSAVSKVFNVKKRKAETMFFRQKRKSTLAKPLTDEQKQQLASAESKGKAEKERKPWSYRCHGVHDIGILEDDPKPFGKKTNNFLDKDLALAVEKRDLKQHLAKPRQLPIEALQERKCAPRTLTSLANNWDRRQYSEDVEAKERKRAFVPKAATPTPVMAKLEQHETDYAQGGKRRGPGALTVHRIDKRVHHHQCEQAESLARHREIMAMFERRPIDPAAVRAASTDPSFHGDQ